MKKIVCFVLAAVLALGLLAGCANNTTQGTEATESQQEQATASQSTEATTAVEEQAHLVFVTPLIAHPVWLVAKEGFEDAAKDLGFRGDWVGPSQIDANEMINQIQTAIAEKADGIITQGMNPEAMVPVLNKANDAGIPVVVTNSDIPDAPRLAYLGTEPINFGNTGAEYILSKMGDQPLKAAFITSSLDYKIGLDIVAGYEQILETAPGGYEKLTVVADNADMLTGVQQVENFLSTYPDCNLIVCCDASAAAASAKVVSEKDLKSQIFIMGIDDIEQTLDGIKEGTIDATMTQNFYRMGYQPAQWIMDYIKDGSKPAELINDSGTMVVNKDNLDTYASDMKVPSSWE